MYRMARGVGPSRDVAGSMQEAQRNAQKGGSRLFNLPPPTMMGGPQAQPMRSIMDPRTRVAMAMMQQQRMPQGQPGALSGLMTPTPQAPFNPYGNTQ